jgi:hypothetical protein
MLLRHTASALALAATVALGAASPANSAGVLPAPLPATTEVGGGPGYTCLGCVAAGVVTLMTGGIGGVWATLMVGGAKAVGYGGAAVVCGAACVAYFNEE